MSRQGVSTEAQFFKDKRRHFIRSLSLLRIEAKDGIGRIFLTGIKESEEISRRNMPRIVQSGVFRKGLRTWARVYYYFLIACVV